MSNKFTPEGMALVCPATFPLNSSYCATGAGDDPTLGIGKGPAFIVATDPLKNALGMYATSLFTVTWQFRDACWLAGGGIDVDGASPGDTIDLYISCPASTVAPAANNTGNCTLVPVSQTTSVIVPAPQGGPYNLLQANPVPAMDGTPAQNPNGQWEWGDALSCAQVVNPGPESLAAPNTGFGSVVPTAVPGSGSYNLLTSSVMLSRFLVSQSLIGSHTRKFAPMLKPKRVLPQWTFTASVYNGGHSGLRVAWYLEIGRVSTV